MPQSWEPAFVTEAEIKKFMYCKACVHQPSLSAFCLPVRRVPFHVFMAIFFFPYFPRDDSKEGREPKFIQKAVCNKCAVEHMVARPILLKIQVYQRSHQINSGHWCRCPYDLAVGCTCVNQQPEWPANTSVYFTSHCVYHLWFHHLMYNSCRCQSDFSFWCEMQCACVSHVCYMGYEICSNNSRGFYIIYNVYTICVLNKCHISTSCGTTCQPAQNCCLLQ